MIRIDGSDLSQAIDFTATQIRDSLDEPTLRAVAFVGADIFRDEAKRNSLAHKQTGLLYHSIIIKRLEEHSDGRVRQVYLVTVREGRVTGQGAYYWRWVEKGHKIVPKNTRISARTGRKIGWRAHRLAAELEYGSRKVPAYPFMRPAYESKKVEATNMMNRTLSEILSRNLRVT